MMPVFQCHGSVPAARRRQTTSSCSSYMPGIRPRAGRGASVNAMYSPAVPNAGHSGAFAARGLASRAKLVQ